MASDRLYIHELIDIRGHNRAKYVHHMTANWVPVAIRERNQRCYGVWGTVGSTGRWPEVVNMWELDGWAGLAANFEHELSNPAMQDASLAEWWAQAAAFRRGGVDRILVPEPETESIDDLVTRRAGAPVYAHELVSVQPGAAGAYLAALRDRGRAVVESFGLALLGAFSVALVNDSECVVIWAIPDWGTWASFEASSDDGRLRAWRASLRELGADWRRTLMVDAPLAPLRLGRQPRESDRRPLDEI